MDASRCPKCGTFSAEEAFDQDLAVAPGTHHITLLSTNEPPEESEIIFIQSLLLKSDARLASLDDEISRLRDRLKQLDEERSSLTIYRARNRAILSPLRRMPPEVLGDIFSWTLPPIRDGDRARFDLDDSPWVLTHISTRWRAIALATPSLWSRIVIDYAEIHKKLYDYPQTRDSSSTYLSLVEAQIQRAQKLKIHFYGSPQMDSRPQIHMFERLLQHSSRWEELSLGLTSQIVPLLTALRGRVSSLKRLWLQWEFESESAMSIDCFQTASCLVDVGVFNQHRFVPILFPVHQLTRYELTGPWRTHESILKAASNLVEARIDVSFHPEPWSDPEQRIDLLRLRRLYVSASAILSALRAPALEELAVCLRSNEGLNPLTILHGFVHRSSCSLRRICLDIRGSPLAYTTTEMLESFSSITELIIMDYDVGAEVNTLISALTTNGSTVVAPQLRSLFFGCAHGNYIDYAVYLEMLKSRWEVGNCALKHVALVALDTDLGLARDSLTLSGLHALRREGLDLVLPEDVSNSEAFGILNGWLYGTTWN